MKSHVANFNEFYKVFEQVNSELPEDPKLPNDNDGVWKKVEADIEPWDSEIMDKLLDEFEKTCPLDDYEWEQIHDIKKALWIGYSFPR